jgi:hypothetical protein
VKKNDPEAFMSDYDKEKWVQLYRAAMLELEHAKMAGRIQDTRIEIAARITGSVVRTIS